VHLVSAAVLIVPDVGQVVSVDGGARHGTVHVDLDLGGGLENQVLNI
jgi:hypothetical protein